MPPSELQALAGVVQVGAQHDRRAGGQGGQQPDQRLLAGGRVDQDPVASVDALQVGHLGGDRLVLAERGAVHRGRVGGAHG